MYLEEKLEKALEEINNLKKEVEELKVGGTEQLLTAKNMAKRMDCSVSALYKWVKEGKLEVVYFGEAYRFPTSQLRGKQPSKITQIQNQKQSKCNKKTLKEQIFG